MLSPLSGLGERLRPEIERLLSDIEYLAIASLPTFGSRWLIARLEDFLVDNPGMRATVI